MSATPQPPLVQLAVHIRHVPGAPPALDHDPVVIDRRKGGDNVEIVWLCSKSFSICFPSGSPFQQRYYGSGDNYTGAIVQDASGTYNYTVEINGQMLDPQIIIRP
jgi:hypothetical protein